MTQDQGHGGVPDQAADEDVLETRESRRYEHPRSAIEEVPTARLNALPFHYTQNAPIPGVLSKLSLDDGNGSSESPNGAENPSFKPVTLANNKISDPVTWTDMASAKFWKKQFQDYWHDFKHDFRVTRHNFSSTDRMPQTKNEIGDSGVDAKKAASEAAEAEKLAASLHGSHEGLHGMGNGEKRRYLSKRESLGDVPLSSFIKGSLENASFRDLYGLIVPRKRQVPVLQAQSDENKRDLIIIFSYAMMLYGAPSHRLEEWVLYLSKHCEVENRINYLPGVMEICFVERVGARLETYTTMIKAQGLDLGKLELVFRIYRAVLKSNISVEEANNMIADVIKTPDYYKGWQLVIIYGLASAIACLWAYGGWWQDLPIAFVLGCLTGLLSVVIASRNKIYSSKVDGSTKTNAAFRRHGGDGGFANHFFCSGVCLYWRKQSCVLFQLNCLELHYYDPSGIRHLYEASLWQLP